MKEDMPDFSCDVNVISAFTVMVLFRCLQHMNEIYKICVLMCFCKFSFSTKNLLEVTSVTLV